MTRSLILQDFAQRQESPSGGGTLVEPAAAPVASPVKEQDEALETYGVGYKNGWADCAAAEAQERRSVGADLVKAIASAKLTHDAAKQDVLASLGPFFEEVVATLLPSMAAEAIAPTVVAEIIALADGQTLPKVELLAAPNVCATLERLVERENITELTVRSEPAFAEGQVSIRAGSERRDLDMAAATQRIAAAIAGFSLQTPPSQSPDLAQGAA